MNTTKKSKPTKEWEVHGSFEFSTDGLLKTKVKALVYVEADDASDAARQAVDRMGSHSVISKVYQINEED